MTVRGRRAWFAPPVVVGGRWSKGVFAGAALDGTVITIDDSANETAYGRKIDGDTVLGGEVDTAPVFEPLVAAVADATPAEAG